MASGFLFPGANRPSTALAGYGDVHDDNIYSAGVLAHGGASTIKLFVSGQGSPVPVMASSALLASVIPAHYQTYTPTTTVIEQSGQLGNSIGDAEIRALGVTIDQNLSQGGVARPYGATLTEVQDILSKTRLEVKISNKRRILGPTWSFPQTGGAMGFTTANAASLAANGLFPTGRKLKSPIVIARTDVLVAEVTADAALAFSDTSFAAGHAGQASLMWVNMVGTVRSDVR